MSPEEYLTSEETAMQTCTTLTAVAEGTGPLNIEHGGAFPSLQSYTYTGMLLARAEFGASIVLV